MLKQREMEENFMLVHRSFLKDLEKSLDMLEKDIEEASEMTKACTDEWCNATENVIDELAKSVYSISEPRWATEVDQQQITELRHKIHELYSKYRSVKH